jgi:hypothetical protein
LIRKLLVGFFSSKNGHLVIVQWPNTWIMLWLILSGLSKTVGNGTSVGIASMAAVTLLTWAYLEISSGASSFRKVLGLVVLAVTLLKIIN